MTTDMEQMPAEIDVDEKVGDENLLGRARKRLNSAIIDGAKELGQELS